MTTTIVCPKCGEGIEAEEVTITDGVLCQACGHDFVFKEPSEEIKVEPEPEPVKEIVPPVPSAPPPPPMTEAERLLARRERLHEWAEDIVTASGFSVFGGICLFVFGLIIVANGTDGGYWVCGGGTAAIAFGPWLYLVAQIVHIRANTEK